MSRSLVCQNALKRHCLVKTNDLLESTISHLHNPSVLLIWKKSFCWRNSHRGMWIRYSEWKIKFHQSVQRSFLTTDLDKSGAFKSSERTVIFDSMRIPFSKLQQSKTGQLFPYLPEKLCPLIFRKIGFVGKTGFSDQWWGDIMASRWHNEHDIWSRRLHLRPNASRRRRYT